MTCMIYDTYGPFARVGRAFWKRPTEELANAQPAPPCETGMDGAASKVVTSYCNRRTRLPAASERETMKAQIFVYYLGNSLYQIVTVVDNGKQTHTTFDIANCDTVTRMRNLMAEQLSESAYHVQASEIPKAWDLGGTR